MSQQTNTAEAAAIINFRVPAGRAVAVLKDKLQGLIAIAPVGYSSGGKEVHERLGFIQEIKPDPTCKHAAFDFLYTDEEGTAETTIVDDEQITLCFMPHQLHLLAKFHRQASASWVFEAYEKGEGLQS